MGAGCFRQTSNSGNGLRTVNLTVRIGRLNLCFTKLVKRQNGLMILVCLNLRQRKYRAALNEGRGLFPRNQEFGDWKQKNVFSQLGITQPKADDDVAAMWAAANQDDFDTARAA